MILMHQKYNNTPLTTRLLKLQNSYREHFPAARPGGHCCWLPTNAEEINMIDALVATEATEGAVLDDLFLTIRCPFEGATTYPAACAEELRQQMRGAEQDLVSVDVDPQLWISAPNVATMLDLARYALHIFAAMPGGYDRVVLYLDPPDNRDEVGYGNQLGELLDAGIPTGLVLMTTTYPGSDLHKTLQRYERQGLTFIEPELNMDAAVADVLATGDPSDPSTIFSQHFAAMAKYGNAGNFTKLRKEARTAIEFVDRQPGYEHLAINVLCAEGAFLLPHKSRLKRAIDCFVLAQHRARVAIADGEPSAAVLLIQALNYEAGAHYQRADYELASERYQLAASEAAKDEAHLFLQYESLRMAAESEHARSTYAAAYDHATQALSIAESLPQKIVRQSTAHFLAHRLLELADRVVTDVDARVVRRRLEALLGVGWADRTPETH